MPKSKKGGEESTLLDFGVEEGEEVSIGDVAWVLLTVPVGCILEVCLAGCSVGMGTEEWFAILVREVNLDDESGLLVGGGVLGCENTTYLPELVGTLSTGFIHLCKGDPCEKESERVVHATKVRLWRLRNFNATYLSRQGKAIMKNALNAESGIAPPKVPAKAPAGAAPKRRAKSKAQAPPGAGQPGYSGRCWRVHRSGSRWRAERRGVWECRRFTEGSLAVDTARDKAADSWGWGPRPRQPAEGLAGGAGLGPTGSAVAERRLVAGTALNPGVLTPLPIGPSVDTSDDEVRRLKKRLNAKGDASSVLLAQAVQTSQRKNKEKKDKKEGSTDRTIRKLAELLGGKKKKKEETEGSRQRRSPRRDVGYQARSRRRRWIRPKQLIQFLFKEPPKEEKGRQQRRLGAVLRGAASKESCKRAGLRDGNACPSRAATARPGRAAGRRRGGGRADEWDKNLNLSKPKSHETTGFLQCFTLWGVQWCKGRCDDRVQWYDVCGTVVRCHGACVVRWYGAMVRWYGAMVRWYGAMVRWYGAMVRRCGAMPHRTNLLHQCTPVHPSHCTEKIAAKTRFFATKTCVFADKKRFFAIKKWCGGPGAVVQLTGTLVQW